MLPYGSPSGDPSGRVKFRSNPPLRPPSENRFHQPLPVMSRLRGRALIAHGRADSSIPYTESLRLAQAADTQAVILATFHHTGPLSLLEITRSGVHDGWRLVRLAEALLSDRGR